MKILFIVPPDTLRIESSVSEKLDKGRELRAALGLLCVAGAVQKLDNVETSLLDCPALNFGYEEIKSEILKFKPDLVALSALTFSLLDALKTARVAKSVYPQAKVCIGGFHVNLFPEETLRQEEIDIIVYGEGEKPFHALVTALRDGKYEEICKIEGIGFKENGRAILNGPGEINKDMDKLSSPAYNLLDLQKYSHVLAESGNSISMQTSRGCPYRCLFCDIRGTKLRYKSPEKVIEEVISLKNMGISDFFFVDDTISVNRERLKNICKIIIKENLNIQYRISARVDTVDSEVLALLKKSGCNRISYGVESGCQRLLDYLEKGITLSQIHAAFRMTRDAGIQTFAFLLIGIPTETEEEMYRSVDFLKKIKADYANISICTPYPKTALYQRMREEGIIQKDIWQLFAENPEEDFEVSFWNKNFSDAELRMIQDKLMKKFYRRPSYIFRQLLRIKSAKELAGKAKMGLKILK